MKELEVALAEGRADLAVHSLKDVPMELPEGFALSAILEREDPRDAFVSNDYADLAALPAGAVVGTSSLRREASLRARFPHLVIQPLRGNLDTRLGKLDRGDYAAIILAAAGLKRLGLAERIRSTIAPEESLPAAGQGALGIEICADRADVQAALAPLHDMRTALAVTAERAVSRILGGSCQVPLASFAQWSESGTLRLRAFVASQDGTRKLAADGEATPSTPAEADALGVQVAQQMLNGGAREILAMLGADAPPAT
ncbi:porphobilinogen deaminase [Ralstonia insidiosa]|uniref:Hydroxymethylbilane synthase n=1 Tax=Ralstonia insidiosa TaxID=190721 RepID=A0AAC9FRA8_9RALS|nr:porphobilinogen deaminase [Ralstonia insidiosa]